jgi:P-type E1-E2 ATPase
VGVIVMILIGMCKECYVEVQRMRKDKAVNSFMIKRMKKFGVDTEEPTFEEVNIVDIKVGDILEIENDGFVPADCILLKTEDPHKHTAYFSTASLEGENYLKKKQTI